MEENDQMMDEGQMMEAPTTFTVRIENVSTPSTLQTSEGSKPVPLSPGVWVVHSGGNPLFTPGHPASKGVERVAEDGFPMMLAGEMKKMQMAMEEDQMMEDEPMVSGDEMMESESMESEKMSEEQMSEEQMMENESMENESMEGDHMQGEGMEDDQMDEEHMGNEMMDEEMMDEDIMAPGAVHASGVFAQPVGQDMNAPLKPGDAYAFTFDAQPGQRLSFITMFVQSNDLFLGPDVSAIALFDDSGQPVHGVMTSRVRLWDAGTEQNEEPGVGAHTKPKQGKQARDVGTKESQPVRLISRVDDGFDYPGLGQVIRVTITPEQ